LFCFNNFSQDNLSILGFQNTLYKQAAVEPGHAVSDYARNIVALGKMEHQRAELFEPKASFRLSRNEPRATVAGHFERSGCPGSGAIL